MRLRLVTYTSCLSLSVFVSPGGFRHTRRRRAGRVLIFKTASNFSFRCPGLQTHLEMLSQAKTASLVLNPTPNLIHLWPLPFLFNPLPPPSADLAELYREKCDTPKFNGVFFNNLFWGRGQSSYVWSVVYTSHVAME